MSELSQLKEVFEMYDVFDEEDIQFVQDEQSKYKGNTVHDEISALRSILLERQKILEKLDETMNLAFKYPELMRKLATKDACATKLIEQKEKEADAKD